MVVVQVARVDVLTHVLTTALVVAGLHVREGVVVAALAVVKEIVTPDVTDVQIIAKDIVRQLVLRDVVALARVIAMEPALTHVKDSALTHVATKIINYWM